MIMCVGELVPGIPVGCRITVERRGMDWCCDSKGNTYIYDPRNDQFVCYVTVALDGGDTIYTGSNDHEEVGRTIASRCKDAGRRWHTALQSLLERARRHS